jgi:hypothetical protein
MSEGGESVLDARGLAAADLRAGGFRRVYKGAVFRNVHLGVCGLRAAGLGRADLEGTEPCGLDLVGSSRLPCHRGLGDG